MFFVRHEMRQNPRMWTCKRSKLPWNQGCFENVSELFFEIKVKFISCLEIKVVFKMRQNCSLKSRLKSTLIFEVKMHESPWNQGCFQNALELLFEIKVKIHLDFRGKIHESPWNQGCFQNAPGLAFYNYCCLTCIQSQG